MVSRSRFTVLVPLAKVMQMAGLVSEDTLVEVLATKIREAVTDVVSWTDGEFEVVPRPNPAGAGVAAGIPVEVCLAIARRRRERLAKAAALIGSDDVSFQVSAGTAPIQPSERPSASGESEPLSVRARRSDSVISAAGDSSGSPRSVRCRCCPTPMSTGVLGSTPAGSGCVGMAVACRSGRRADNWPDVNTERVARHPDGAGAIGVESASARPHGPDARTMGLCALPWGPITPDSN